MYVAFALFPEVDWRQSVNTSGTGIVVYLLKYFNVAAYEAETSSAWKQLYGSGMRAIQITLSENTSS